MGVLKKMEKKEDAKQGIDVEKFESENCWNCWMSQQKLKTAMSAGNFWLTSLPVTLLLFCIMQFHNLQMVV